MKRVTVVNVSGLRGEARERVCYVGRAFAGWLGSRWGNPQRVRANRPVADALAAFRTHMAHQPEEWFEALWEACRHSDLPLGCWCYDGRAEDGQHVCHAAILAQELNRRFVDGEPLPA